jgi:bifunctional DNA-binding transcriptional regulator/antitoxin component of YhaV-PrlF toxin-antitoxin module
MKAYEFPAEVTADGTVVLPHEILTHFPISQKVRVIVLVDEAAEVQEQSEWSKLAAEKFATGYSASDAVYDTL